MDQKEYIQEETFSLVVLVVQDQVQKYITVLNSDVYKLTHLTTIW